MEKKMRTLFMSAVLAAVLCLPAAAQAAHSIRNPMAPRQLSPETGAAAYSYGLTVLPGRSLDALDPAFRYAGWAPNYYFFDRYILRPVAHGYARLPDGVRSSVGNFFNNLSDINNSVNHLLTGGFAGAGVSLGRFALNSTFGILGLFDVAGALGLEYAELSMNTVMGRAGADQGLYMMLPLAGPYTERSLNGAAVDNWPYYLWSTFWVDLALWAVEGIHVRAGLIDQEGLIDDAIDPYAQTRQIYLMYAEGRVDPEAALKTAGDDAELDSFMDEIDAE